jgi:hypothetical protein
LAPGGGWTGISIGSADGISIIVGGGSWAIAAVKLLDNNTVANETKNSQGRRRLDDLWEKPIARLNIDDGKVKALCQSGEDNRNFTSISAVRD